VELISKNTSLYDMQRCGNKYFRLCCVYRVQCSVRHTTQHAINTSQPEILVATMQHIT